MKNKALVIVLLVVVILVVVYLLFSQKGYAPMPDSGSPASAPVEDDTSAAINQELEGVDLGNLEAEFQGIDQDLNNL